MSVPASRLARQTSTEPPPSLSAPSWLDRGTGGHYLIRPRGLLLEQTPLQLLRSNPRRVGAWIANMGGKCELPIDLGAGDRLGSALPATQFIDSAGLAVPSYPLSSYKSLLLIVDTALAWVTAAQATLQLIVGRGPWSPASGAATGAGGDTQNTLKGAAASLGAAGAVSLARGIYVFSPADVADLQWQHPYVGAELKFGSALTAGAARLFCELPGGPAVLLGEDEQMSANLGDRANSFMLPPQDAPMFVQTDRELWAAATPGGAADVRIWEVLLPTPHHASDGSEPR